MTAILMGAIALLAFFAVGSVVARATEELGCGVVLGLVVLAAIAWTLGKAMGF